jgi:hypothetical protein
MQLLMTRLLPNAAICRTLYEEMPFIFNLHLQLLMDNWDRIAFVLVHLSTFPR